MRLYLDLLTMQWPHSLKHRFYETWSLRKFVQIAQRTWKTRRTGKYISATRPKNTFIEIVTTNISKYPKLIRLLVDNNGLGSSSYS